MAITAAHAETTAGSFAWGEEEGRASHAVNEGELDDLTIASRDRLADMTDDAAQRGAFIAGYDAGWQAAANGR